MKRKNVRKIEQLFDNKSRATGVLLDFLMRYPHDSFTLSELAKQANLSKSTINRLIEALQKEGLIVVGHLANLLRIQYNNQNLGALGAKIGYNIIKTYQSNIIDYIMQKWGAPKAIILFGSFRKGEDVPGSDVDIAIEIPEEKELQVYRLDMFNDESARLLRNYEKKIERKFQIILFNRKKIDSNLFTNIANGIVLYGLLEAHP